MYARVMVMLVTLKGNYFVYFQVFSKILGLLTMAHRGAAIRLGSRAHWWNQCKDRKGRVLCVNEAYTLSSTSGKDYGKEAIEAMMAKMNANINGKTKNPVFIFAGYPCEMENFLRLNPGLSRRIPNFLQFNDYTPMELADITNKILLTYEMSYPQGFRYVRRLFCIFPERN